MEPEDFIADMEQMTVNESSVKKTRKLASKKGSSNAGIEAGEDDEPSSVPPQRRARSGANITFQQKVSAMTFFRICDFCWQTDNDILFMFLVF